MWSWGRILHWMSQNTVLGRKVNAKQGIYQDEGFSYDSKSVGGDEKFYTDEGFWVDRKEGWVESEILREGASKLERKRRTGAYRRE